MKAVTLALLALTSCSAFAQSADARVQALKEVGFKTMGAYRLLDELSVGIGPRLSGSANAAKAVEWGKATMEALGFDNVHLMPCMVPHWVRGDVEKLVMVDSSGNEIPLTCCALGGSVGTPEAGIEAEVVEVHSVEEGQKLGDRARGKFVFFNGPMDPKFTSTFEAYGNAVGQRASGALTAAGVGGVGALVRSMTMDPDDFPHTGGMRYKDGVPKVPGVALSIVAANKLSAALARGPVKVRLKLECQTLPDAPSANVVGEIRGSERPNEVIVVGGHLDSWDKGRGAHDDGAGVCQSLEALRVLKTLGWKPKRTIRVVLFMNEENGARGGKAYAEYVKTSGEKHVAAIETDAGGFAPRGFGVSFKKNRARFLDKWLPFLRPFEIDHFTPEGEGGTDIEPMGDLHVVLFGLEPESARYFDYHHSDKDTIDKVNPRELQEGALALAMLAWLISENGL